MTDFLPDSVLRRNHALQELLELCRSVIADGVVTREEAEGFRNWLANNPTMIGVPPVNHLVPVLRRIYDDDVLTIQERTELLETLIDLAGEDNPHGELWGRLHRPEKDR